MTNDDNGDVDEYVNRKKIYSFFVFRHNIKKNCCIHLHKFKQKN